MTCEIIIFSKIGLISNNPLLCVLLPGITLLCWEHIPLSLPRYSVLDYVCKCVPDCMLSVCVLVSICVSPSLCVSVHFSISVFHVCLCLHISLSAFISVWVSQYECFLFLSVSVNLCVYMCLSICLCVCVSPTHSHLCMSRSPFVLIACVSGYK